MSALWLAALSTVRGASHLRNGLPNQDAIGVRPKAMRSVPADRFVVAVADGHGSAKNFRSDIGARLAVRVAERELWGLLDSLGSGADSQIVNAGRDFVLHRLPRILVDTWQKKAALHLRLAPLRPEELARLAAQAGTDAAGKVQKTPLLAYGTTLLATAAMPGFVAHLQLGDGEILEVSEDGSTMRPLEADARLLGNETTSLCGDNAWNDFRVTASNNSNPPALIVLTTDGYPTSFPDDTNFLQVGRGLLDAIETEGVDEVARSLPEWLAEASQKGSGDDCTMAVLCRADVNMRRCQPLPAEAATAGVDEPA
jgi:serine/threonine protein phosphatase PrpC